MRSGILRTAFLLLLFFSYSLSAQEGHPAKGSWIGEWQGNEVHGEFVLLVLDWDGKEITGIINPGTDNIDIDSAILDPETWTLTIEAGDYVLEGTFHELELPSRSLVGTWSHPQGSGVLEIVRQ